MARGGGGGRRKKRQEATAAAEAALASGSVVLPEVSVEEWSVPPSVDNPVNWREVKYNPDKSDYYSDYGTVLRDSSEAAVTPEEAALQRMADADQRAANQEAFANATEEEKVLRAQNNKLEKYGVSSADFGNKVLTDQEMFSLTSRLDSEVTNTQTSNLSALAQENPEKFTEEYGKLQKSSQLKFLNKLYKENTLNKEDYLNAAAQTLMAADGFDRNVYTIQNGQLYTAPSHMADSAASYSKVILFDNQVTGNNEYNTFDYQIGQETDAGRDLTGSKLSGFLNSLPIKAAASSLGFAGVAGLTALRAATGETLHAKDWTALVLSSLSEVANTTGTTTAEAQASASATVEEAISNGTVTTAAEAQALYENTLASIDVSGTFMGIDLTDFATDADVVTSAGQDIVDAVSSLEAAAEGEGDGIVLNLLEDTVDSPEDVFSDTTTGIEIVNEIVNTVLTDEEDEIVPITGVTPDMPETIVDLEQPELDIEPIVADPIEEVIPQPTLPEVVEEEVVEQEEETEAGGGGEPAPEPVAPTEPVEPVEGTLDDILLRQVYEAVLAGEIPLDEYIRMGGIFVDELRQGIPANEVYDPVVEPELPPAAELDETGEPTEEDTVIFPAPIFEEDPAVIDIIGDITEDTTAPVIDPIDTIADPIDTAQPLPVDTVTDTVTDSVTDVISDVIGTGDGTGTGEGTGTGDGSGTGDGTGDGTGTGLGFGSATRTTDSLFGDMLQLETQIGSTQERLKPFSLAPVPSIMRYDVPPVDPIQQFLQQQEALRLRNKPQGMLTNAEILKRFPY
jgi:hypothetical protein